MQFLKKFKGFSEAKLKARTEAPKQNIRYFYGKLRFPLLALIISYWQ